MNKFKEIMAQIDTKNEQVRAIFDKADKEQNGEETPEQIAEIRQLNKEIAELEDKASQAKEGDELRRKAEARRAEALEARRLPVGGKGEGDPNPSERYREARKTLADQIGADGSFEQWYRSITKNGPPSQKTVIQSPTFPVRTLITGSSDTSAGAGVQTDYKPTVDTPYKPLTLLDLITRAETTSDLVEYVRINSRTNNASVVAEATATDDGTGYKPESAAAFDKIQAAVKTIATWIPVTNRALDDWPGLRTWINEFLMQSVQDVLEQEMLTGDGTGEHLTGILNTSGILAQAYTTDIIKTARKARTKIATNGYVMPTAYVFSPTDWESYDLSVDSNGDYYFGGPSVLGTPRLWGLPVVENYNLTNGTGLCGAFRYAVLWDRMQAAITMSNQHSDFFVRNLVAILAELRAAFGVTYPKGFCTVAMS